MEQVFLPKIRQWFANDDVTQVAEFVACGVDRFLTDLCPPPFLYTSTLFRSPPIMGRERAPSRISTFPKHPLFEMRGGGGGDSLTRTKGNRRINGID
ncbi:hypothetical protein HNY73_017664 [Argiope bruennichi]|uniref:Uncharacterized protein n=1 Tax=Argiope bruennichi TaxID=94029 RepID=A0A8T0EBS9_ARGBR|nr:hypothetical protein HNY73_017664 [Argiope bruennichi]